MSIRPEQLSLILFKDHTCVATCLIAHSVHNHTTVYSSEFRCIEDSTADEKTKIEFKAIL